MPKRPKPPKNCYWRGPVLWGRTQVASKEYKWSLRTGDVATARRRIEAERKRLVAETHFGEQRHRYEDVFPEWSAHIVSQVSEQTALRYAVSLRQLEPELIPLLIDEIDKTTCIKIVKRRREEGASTATIRRDLTALSSVLEYAEDQDYREGNPALARLRKLKERRDPIVLPEHDHIERVAKRTTTMFAALIRVAVRTGCREAELTKAERRNYDPVKAQLTVRGKGKKTRTIDLDEVTNKTLRELPVFLGSSWLFWHDHGDRFTSPASNFRRLVQLELKAAQKSAQQQGLKECDFRPMRFHDLRHRHAVDWLKELKSIYDLQKRLGHSSIKTTEIYLDFLTPEEARIVKGESPQKPAQEQRSAEAKSA